MSVYSLIPRLLCVGGGKKESLVHTVHAQFPQHVWEYGILLRYTNLHKGYQLLPYKKIRCLPLTMLCANDDERATKVFSSSLAGIVHVFVHSR